MTFSIQLTCENMLLQASSGSLVKHCAGTSLAEHHQRSGRPDSQSSFKGSQLSVWNQLCDSLDFLQSVALAKLKMDKCNSVPAASGCGENDVRPPVPLGAVPSAELAQFLTKQPQPVGMTVPQQAGEELTACDAHASRPSEVFRPLASTSDVDSLTPDLGQGDHRPSNEEEQVCTSFQNVDKLSAGQLATQQQAGKPSEETIGVDVSRAAGVVEPSNTCIVGSDRQSTASSDSLSTAGQADAGSSWAALCKTGTNEGTETDVGEAIPLRGGTSFATDFACGAQMSSATIQTCSGEVSDAAAVAEGADGVVSGESGQQQNELPSATTPAKDLSQDSCALLEDEDFHLSRLFSLEGKSSAPQICLS